MYSLLMLVAYRGYSVILFAPLVALGAVLFTRPVTVAPVFSDIFMDKLIGFVKLYFPVFLLGAVFGKLIEFAGFYYSIVSAVTCMVGQNKAMPMIILVCALLTYGGVSLFVVAFANLFFTWLIPHIYGDQFMMNLPGLKKPL
ncbi:GntP family permease [Salmonella enterica]|nr:GntP family permease [Salmonella enterica]